MSFDFSNNNIKMCQNSHVLTVKVDSVTFIYSTTLETIDEFSKWLKVIGPK